MKTLYVAAALACFSVTAGAQQSVVLRAARMITIANQNVVQNAAVVVTGNKIAAAGPASSVAVPPGATIIDLGDVTLLPGFIDAHTHITGRTLGDPAKDQDEVRDYAGYAAILAVDNARKT